MGSVSRFLSAVGGVALLLLALGLFVVPIVQTLAEPEYADFPGGAFGIVTMLLLMASVPVFGAVVLLRRAVRRAAPNGSMTERVIEGVRPSSATSTPGTVASTPPPVAPVSDDADPARAASLPRGDSGIPAEAESVSTTSTTTAPRRIWLAMTGLAVALMGVVFATSAGGYLANTESEAVGAMVAIVLGAAALWLGVRMARAGDPEIGRGFLNDLGLRSSTAGRSGFLVRLIGTSFGRGVLTVAIGVPLTIASADLAPLTGPYAMTIFSIVDPLPMAVQPRWWRNAFISATVCFVLYLIFAATVQSISRQPDAIIGFILPFMAYPATMALSGAIRFFQWLSPAAPKNPRG